MKKAAALFTLLFAAAASFGFPLPYEIIINNEDDILQYAEEGFFEGYDTDALIDMFRNKTELNTASVSELREVPYMTRAWAAAVAERRKDFPLTRSEDIIAITGMSRHDFSLISPFIEARWTAVVRGVTITDADGSSGVLRQTAAVPGLKVGVRAEGRDRVETVNDGADDVMTGEAFRVRLEDWYFVRHAGKWSAVLGKYRMHFNEGLGVSGGSIRSAEGVRPELSGADHFYGAAVSGDFGSIGLDVFYSDINKDEYRYVLNGDIYEYRRLYDYERVAASGGRVTARFGGVSLYAGLYGSGSRHSLQDIRYAFACRATLGRGNFSAELATDGADCAFQAGLDVGGKGGMIRSKFFSNTRGLALPLSDSVRNNWLGYFETGYSRSKGSFSGGATLRSYHGEDESKTLTYAFVRNDFGRYGRVDIKYNKYETDNDYWRFGYHSAAGADVFSADYTIYRSGYEKYTVGAERELGKLRLGLYSSYGGAYDWGARIRFSACWEPSRRLYLRGGYYYSENESEPYEWDAYLRVSIY